ncbi:metallophosphoesterase [Aliidiomarina maris]|uniref:Serine/threonine protein phosphatase 1 n=1 Tax=Aliidiomarina maris TaxID=531312 RepID=A0A327X404_9GAMM|nr:metallophosphoesterase [Aliidiomarina maris]MBA3987738.1 hypothetical protein [Idiomarina sp.]MCL5049391.1 metallophosphoesterase [Bacillota bacterium]RAK01461.1 serine/threonine protein phosphatase 1 [Aliidiomarina maris]RUO28298.1 hypothetical protein CWE07_00395 [Aliidiomarina maris]
MARWQLKQNVLTLAANQAGRDFVVGDLHGSLNLLERALKQLGFNPEQDRLLSVGDLIDRGEDSQTLLEYLDKPWFFACIGNHESVLLDYMHGGDSQLAATWQRFGGEWFFQLRPSVQQSMLDTVLQKAHFAIEILTPEGRPQVGVVHADVPFQLSWDEFTAALANDAEVRYQALWSRLRGRGEVQNVVLGIDNVVCGHEIVAKAHCKGNVWLIDTGAYRAAEGLGRLTIFELPQQLHEFS